MQGSDFYQDTNKTARALGSGGLVVVKADGTEEIFDPAKLEFSLTRSGASKDAVQHVMQKIERELIPGMTTSRIYRRAFSLLTKMERPAASRYSLKRAILELGPSGFPFEDYMAAIFRAKGYETRSRVVVQGHCAPHELDLIAKKDGHCIAAEIKFHNNAGLKSDIKIALYIHARFMDLIDRKKTAGTPCEIHEGWAITNTKFTDEAHHYAACAGLTILDWSYPAKGNLQDWIEETHSHPLTCLTTLSRVEKTRLLNKGVVLCNSLPNNGAALSEAGVSDKKVDSIFKEVENLCTPV